MEDLGLNQMDMGLLLGVYPSTISRWTNPESGRHAVPGYFALILEWLRDIPEVRSRALRRLGKADGTSPMV